MPTYEYACKSCGQHLEVVQSFRDEPLAQCPGCGGPLRKVFGSIGISFKGSGFYRNDSRSTSGSSRGEAGSSSSESTGSSSESASTTGSAKSSDSSSSGSGSPSGSTTSTAAAS